MGVRAKKPRSRPGAHGEGGNMTSSEKGFSLIELMMAAFLTVGLMGAVFALMNQNQNVFVAESGVTDMNQNLRTVDDLLTRDVQSAGMGMSRINGSFAAIFYTNGANGSPDTIMIINGDPFAPEAEVTDRAGGSAELFCMPPPDVTVTGNGSNQTMTYLDEGGNPKPIYKDSATTGIHYICYDDTNAMIFDLTKDGQIVGNGASARLKLQHNPTSSLNPPSVFGSLLDTQEPDYANAQISVLGSLIAYRLNQQTDELERTEDLQNWYTVAQGVTNFQIEYRVVSRDNTGQIVEQVTSAPTDRRAIRAVIFTISAKTADFDPSDKAYRVAVQKFEAAPRNFNLLNNNNLSSNTKSTWQF